jgi:hypothetical protein
MRCNVVRGEARETLQLHHGLAAIEADAGVAMAYRDFAMALQITQRLAFQVKLVLPRHKVGNDVRPALAVRGEREQVVMGTAGHGGMAGPPHERIVARSALHDDRASTADKLRAMRATQQGSAAAGCDDLVDEVVPAVVTNMMMRTGHALELEGAARDSGTAEGAIDAGMASLGDRVATVAQIDRVVPARAVLENAAGALQRNVIVAGPYRHRAAAIDVDRIVAIAGNDGAIAVDVHIRIAATGDTDKRAHRSSPVERRLDLPSAPLRFFWALALTLRRAGETTR